MGSRGSKEEKQINYVGQMNLLQADSPNRGIEYLRTFAHCASSVARKFAMIKTRDERAHARSDTDSACKAGGSGD